jgi:hypothetical protein
MKKIEYIALISIILIILLMVITMPWPANVIIGGMLFSGFIVDFIYSRIARKRKRDNYPPEITGNPPVK